MGSTIKDTRLDNVIADLERRIAVLETGGKPLVDGSSIASGSATIAAGSASDIAITFSWTSDSVAVNPNGTLYSAVYVDNDNVEEYQLYHGSSLSAGQKKVAYYELYDASYLSNYPYETKVRVRLENNDSSQHTYYLYFIMLFIAGGSADSSGTS